MSEIIDQNSWRKEERGLRERLVVLNIDPEKDKLIRTFLPQMAKEHVLRYEKTAEWIEKRLTTQEGTIADLGTGQGYGANILRKRLPSFKVVGIEIDYHSLRKAKRKQEGPSYLQGEAQKIPLKSGSVQAITAFELMEHLSKSDQEQLVIETARVLSPGALFFLSVPYPYSETADGKRGASANPHHLHEPSHQEVEELIKIAGLNIVGRFGQAFVPQKEIKLVRRITNRLPLWPVYVWVIPRDFSIKKTNSNKIPLTHIFIAQKPEE